mmetsp:Transcript_824/g.2976  ORF Transcript_824/g.2976 Transcript_824/m.2976 type:complete len:103 (+) Transcript_824:326-634(+)
MGAARRFVDMQHRAKAENYDVLIKMPPAIRSQLIRAMYQEFTVKTHFMKGTSSHFQEVMLAHMEVETAVPKTWIIEETDYPDRLLVITAGAAIVAIRVGLRV